MSETTPVRESIRVLLFPDIPGLSILEVVETSREWRWLSTDFSMAVPTTWHGEICYRRRQEDLLPGKVFCSEPGEIHATPRVQRGGNFHGFMIEPEVFDSYAAEHGIRLGRAEWSRIVQDLSPTTASSIAAVLRLARSTPTALEAQSRVVEMFESLARELLVATRRQPPKSPGSGVVAQIRDCLHDDDSANLDLKTLATRFGMSRFQVLRSFRARYGLPPHAYQLCVRIGRARDLLKRGTKVSDVSALCGFADQSHFGRHFKRHIGLTPGQFALQVRGVRTGLKSRVDSGHSVGTGPVALIVP